MWINTVLMVFWHCFCFPIYVELRRGHPRMQSWLFHYRFGLKRPWKLARLEAQHLKWRLHPGKWPYTMLTLDVSMVSPISRNLPGQWSTTSRSTPTRSKHWHSQRSVASSFAGFTVGVHAFVWRRLRVANIQWPEDSSRCCFVFMIKWFCCF